MKQFKLAKIIVDVNRCQIECDGELIKIEPKVMDVFQYFAAHQGEVISQEDLFASLWPGSIFNPGSVQRCITQLRKALGDDSKHQKFIITHPKRGYSLNIAVTEITKKSKVSKKQMIWLLLILITGFIVSTWWGFQKAPTHTFIGSLEPLTTSHTYDFLPVYSSDGVWLAFIRQDKGVSHIWLKNLYSGEFHQLSKLLGDFQSLAWSDDNQSIVYVIRGDNEDQVGILSLDINQPTQPTLFQLPGSGNIWKVQWSGDLIFYMYAQVPANQAPLTQLKSYNIKTRQHQLLLKSSSDFTPYRIALSPNRKWIALAGEDKTNGAQIRIFDLNNNTLGKTLKNLKLGFTEISWHPSSEQLLILHQNSLYLLGLDGEFETLPYQNFQHIYNPTFNSDGSNIIFSSTEEDVDIFQYQLSTKILTKVVDSTGEDSLARIAPDNKSIAYLSSKSGYQQVYVQRGDQSKLIYNNHSGRPIYRSPVWSPDSKIVTFITDKQIHFYDLLTEKLSSFFIEEEVTSVLDWYNQEASLLITQKISNTSNFAKYNLATRGITKITETGVNYSGRLSTGDELFFLQNGLIVNASTHEKYTFPALAEMENGSSVFPVQSGFVYQSENVIWISDLKQEKIFLDAISDMTSSLMDVSQDGEILLFHSNEISQANLLIFR